MQANRFAIAFAAAGKLARLIGKALLECVVKIGGENAAEDFLTLLGACLKELAEIPLCDHCDLAELVAINAKQIANRRRDGLGFGNCAAVGTNQLGICAFLCFSAAAQRGARVFGIARYGIFLPVIEKFERNERLCARKRVFRAQHIAFPIAAAGRAVEGEGDRVKDRGFACAGIAGDQVKPRIAEAGKVDFRFPRIGTERGQRELQRSHTVSSFSSSISSATIFLWRSLMGWLFCFSNSSSNS